MVTGIFGSISLADNRRIDTSLINQAKYGTTHAVQLKDIDNGQLGSVMICKDANHLTNFSLKESGDLIICADMTLYNREELINKLDMDMNAVDNELLIYAFRKWKYKCVEHLIGDFAFVIWDTSEKELFCARDQIGIRPFYYCRFKKGFAFASELRILKSFNKATLTLCKEFLYDTLITDISDKSLTAFEEIFRLPPAHYIVYKHGSILIQKYWQLNPEQEIRYQTEDDYIAHFSEMLKNTVKSRCGEVTKFGSELSGGLDSTAITCIASEFVKDSKIQFSAFSNTLPVYHNTVMKDEREHILKVLELRKIHWYEVNELKICIPDLIEQTLNLQSCFTQQRFHMFNKGLFEAAAKFGSRVLLSGFGGDEMVSARTGNAWNDLIDNKQWKYFYQDLKYYTFLPKAVLKGLKVLVAYQLKKNRKPGITSGIFTPGMLTRRFDSLPLQPQFVIDNQLKERYFKKHEKKAEMFLAYRQLQRINHQHVPQRLEYSYAAAANYGIQYRYPLLDIRLLQTYLSFPAWIKNRPGTDRYLFRQSLKGVIPEEIRLRADKTGAVIPHTYLRLKNDREMILDFIKKCAFKGDLNHIFDFSRFEGWIDALLERNPDEMNYLMPGAFYNYLMILYWFNRSNGKI